MNWLFAEDFMKAVSLDAKKLKRLKLIFCPMEIFKIVFKQESYNKENAFVPNVEYYLTSAIITKSIDNDEERYKVKLNDIGLDSRFGEFFMVRKNGFWQSTDQDDVEFNLLKHNITTRIEEMLK